LGHWERGLETLSPGKRSIISPYRKVILEFSSVLKSFFRTSAEDCQKGGELSGDDDERCLVWKNLCSLPALLHCHLQAVENRVFITRAANTGITGFIDPRGKILNKERSLQRRQ